MWKTARLRWFVAALLVLAYVLAAGPAGAQDSTSAALAAQLAELMTNAELDALAGTDSTGEDRFVAALVFPGQLLVVSARYEVPIYVEDKIANGEYREVYIDLNAASIGGTKVLVVDVGANGLRTTAATVDLFDGRVRGRAVRWRLGSTGAAGGGVYEGLFGGRPAVHPDVEGADCARAVSPRVRLKARGRRSRRPSRLRGRPLVANRSAPVLHLPNTFAGDPNPLARPQGRSTNSHAAAVC